MMTSDAAMCALHRSQAMPAHALRADALTYLEHTPGLPLPGSGSTLERWRALAAIGARDLALAKVLEAHFDAQAILSELGQRPTATGELWAVWAAEPPDARLEFVSTDGAAGRLTGTKAWCSGAGIVSHALVTAAEGQERVLCRMALDDPRVGHDERPWQAVGMARITSGTLEMAGVRASRVGAPGAYLSRPGFWHGGAGIAACWFGAAAAIAGRLQRDRRVCSSPHAAAHLGAIDAAMSAAAALMRETAGLIDAQPGQAHRHAVVRLRTFVERVGSQVMERAGRALGAGPLCTEGEHAQRCADLTTFLRQSHAETDEQWLGTGLAQQESAAWRL